MLVVVFASMARKPDYAVAFANLRDEDAGAIVTKLKDGKVPYELGERGTIRVPAGQVEEVRLLVAGQGLSPKGGVGFDFFNQPHFGFTEFAEKVNFQRALENELRRTISQMETVESARVHLVIPQPSLFSSNQKEATASVVVQPKPGRRLDASQVLGITGLVASSVEGMKTHNVSVMDTAGNVLTERQGQDGPAQHSDRRSAVQRSVEARLEDDLHLMLNRVLGPDKAIVRVGAELDWDQHEANTETFSPPNKPPQLRSQRESTEVNQGGGPSGGVPGTVSNVPSYQGQGDARGQSQTERRDVSSTYELSKTVEKVVRAPGEIKRLSVAVALDSEAIGNAEQVDAISRLIATAVGLDVARGDVVTLTTLAFAPPPERREATEWARRGELALGIGRILAIAIGPLLVLLIIARTTQRRGPMRAGAPDPQSAIRHPQSAIPGGALEPLPRARPEDLSAARLQKELGTFAQSDPDTVAQIVRGWMLEDRGAR
jgi:flagellar M-ring protein FliF